MSESGNTEAGEAPVLPVSAHIKSHRVFNLPSEHKKVAWYDIQTAWADGSETIKRQRFGRIHDALVKLQTHAARHAVDALRILPANISLSSSTSQALRDSRMQEVNRLLAQCMQHETLRSHADLLQLLTPDTASSGPLDLRSQTGASEGGPMVPRLAGLSSVQHWAQETGPGAMGPSGASSAVDVESSVLLPSTAAGRSEFLRPVMQNEGMAGPQIPREWPHRTGVMTPVLRGSTAVQAQQLIAACQADMKAAREQLVAHESDAAQMRQDKRTLQQSVEFWRSKAERLEDQVEKLLQLRVSPR